VAILAGAFEECHSAGFIDDDPMQQWRDAPAVSMASSDSPKPKGLHRCHQRRFSQRVDSHGFHGISNRSLQMDRYMPKDWRN